MCVGGVFDRLFGDSLGSEGLVGAPPGPTELPFKAQAITELPLIALGSTEQPFRAKGITK